MNQPVRKSQSPSFNFTGELKKFEDVRAGLKTVARYIERFTGAYLDPLLSSIIDQVNSQVQSVGLALPSAPTIIPTNPVHHVSGTAAVDTINVPAAFSGPLFLIPDDAWTFVTGGNIGKAATAIPGQAMTVVYDFNLWWPSY